MSLKLEMLQVQRLAPNLLGESSEQVVQFLIGQRHSDGGYKDRSGNSDLYYTVFGTESLIGMHQEVPVNSLKPYLKTFNDITQLDLVHLSCLARCWSDLPKDMQVDCPVDSMIDHLETFRSKDGGYHVKVDNDYGSVYGAFLALGICQDLESEIPNPERMLASIEKLRTDDGGYANQPDLPIGLTPSAAAAVTILRHYGQELPSTVGEWLLERCYQEGGFFAAPMAPIPDLLSTATALHALASLQIDLTPIQEINLDYVDSLWDSQGSFYGNWSEQALDCEYTYYGLLALGHLSL